MSTQKQGQSGLGEEAQRAAVANYVCRRGKVLREFQEVESGRKSAKHRPKLMEALDACRKEGAALVIGKLGRLSRDVRYFLEVIDDSGVDIRFADLPDICPVTDEGRMILVSMANFAEFEGCRISTRTRAALSAAKARGVVLGSAGPSNLRQNIQHRQEAAAAFALRLRPLLEGMLARGLSQRAMVRELNAVGVPASRGGQWSLGQVQRVLFRLPAR